MTHKQQQIMQAIENDLIKPVYNLVDEPQDLWFINEEGYTPLHLAINKGNHMMVRVLIEEGADVNQINSDGESPLAYAIFCHEFEIARMLLDYGANDVNPEKYEDYHPAFIYSIEKFYGKYKYKKMKQKALQVPFI